MSELKPIKKWNIISRMDKTCIRVIEEYAIVDLDVAIAKCKTLRRKFPTKLWTIELNTIEDI